MTQLHTYRLFEDDGKVSGRVVEMDVDKLSEGEVTLRVAYSSVNYKDARAAIGQGKIIRSYPRIGCIDLAGTVAASRDARLREGDEVVVHGFGMGVDTDAGHAQYARVLGDWILPLPAGLSLLDAATIGVAVDSDHSGGLEPRFARRPRSTRRAVTVNSPGRGNLKPPTCSRPPATMH